MNSNEAGLQAERTLLAWRRTVLAATAVLALSVHQAAHRGWGAAIVPVVVMLLALLVILWCAHRRARVVQQRPLRAARGAVIVTSLAVVTSALVVLATSLVSG